MDGNRQMTHAGKVLKELEPKCGAQAPRVVPTTSWNPRPCTSCVFLGAPPGPCPRARTHLRQQRVRLCHPLKPAGEQRRPLLRRELRPQLSQARRLVGVGKHELAGTCGGGKHGACNSVRLTRRGMNASLRQYRTATRHCTVLALLASMRRGGARCEARVCAGYSNRCAGRQGLQPRAAHLRTWRHAGWPA